MPASSAPVEVELEEKAVPVRFTKTLLAAQPGCVLSDARTPYVFT